MFAIRKGVFETNSSSVHAMCICTEDDYNKWAEDNCYIDFLEGEIYTEEELRKIFEEDDTSINDFNKWRLDNEFYTYDEFWDESRWFDETYKKVYSVSPGDKIICFGYFGMN